LVYARIKKIFSMLVAKKRKLWAYTYEYKFIYKKNIKNDKE